MKIIKLLIAVFFSICFYSCSNDSSSDSTGSKVQESSGNNLDQRNTASSSCACSTSDVNRLAYKVVNEYTRIQNELPSDVARVMNVDGVEQRDNCTWVVTFKVSWPFGNTDGAHPDEFIKKRYACDGKEVYQQ